MELYMSYLKKIFAIKLCFILYATALHSEAALFHKKESAKINNCRRILGLANPRLMEDANGQKIWVQKVVNLPIPFSPLDYDFSHVYRAYIVNGAYEFEVPVKKLVNETLLDVMAKYPRLLKNYGFYLRKTVLGNTLLHFPGTLRLNELLDLSKGTINEKPFRFKDWFPRFFSRQTQHYPHLEFVKALANGHILLATDEYEFFHDRISDHMIGILLMPGPIFINFQQRARILLGLQERFLDRPGFNSYFESSVDNLASWWDFRTAIVPSYLEMTLSILVDKYIDTNKEPFYYNRVGYYSRPVDHTKNIVDDLASANLSLSDDDKSYILNLVEQHPFAEVTKDIVRTSLQYQLNP